MSSQKITVTCDLSKNKATPIDFADCVIKQLGIENRYGNIGSNELRELKHRIALYARDNIEIKEGKSVAQIPATLEGYKLAISGYPVKANDNNNTTNNTRQLKALKNRTMTSEQFSSYHVFSSNKNNSGGSENDLMVVPIDWMKVTNPETGDKYKFMWGNGERREFIDDPLFISDWDWGVKHPLGGFSLTWGDGDKRKIIDNPDMYIDKIIERKINKVSKWVFHDLSPIRELLEEYLKVNPRYDYASADIALPIPIITSRTKGNVLLGLELNVDKHNRTYIGMGLTHDPKWSKKILSENKTTIVGKSSLTGVWGQPVNITASKVIKVNVSRKDLRGMLTGTEINLFGSFMHLGLGATHSFGAGLTSADTGLSVDGTGVDMGLNYSIMIDKDGWVKDDD